MVRRLGAVLVTAVLVLGTDLAWSSAAPAQEMPGQVPSDSSATAARTGVAGKAANCPKVKREFKPTRVSIPALGSSFRVRKVGRTRSGEMGTPPLSSAGKWTVGWYPSRGPGTRAGSVPLNAHTYPDGSALGNAMLRSLRSGHVLWLQRGKRWACYQVTQQATYPRARAPRKRIFGAWGKPRLAIIVCSGQRLGPRNWTHRTVWFAVPYTGKI